MNIPYPGICVAVQEAFICEKDLTHDLMSFINPMSYFGNRMVLKCAGLFFFTVKVKVMQGYLECV